MELPLLIYLSIDNQFKRKCIEDLIVEQIHPNAEIIILTHPEKILEVDFETIKTKNIYYVVDCNTKEITNVKMLNLNKENPNLKTLVFIDKFDYNKIKLLFNIGVKGVSDKGISPDEFIEIFNAISRGELSITASFQKQLLAEFCKNDESFNLNKEIKPNGEIYNSFDDLYGLTKREKEILFLVCNGENTKEISDKLFISLHTAETHRRNILTKLNAKNTAEMVKFAMKYNLIS